MATTKTFNNVRLQLKYDTLSNWTTNDPVLLAGEIAITSVPNATGDVHQAPAVLMKVGDGSKKFSELQFVSGMAANVHGWALEANKPSYTAGEIGGLEDAINATVQDTNTTYQIVKVNDYSYKLQYKDINGSWTDVAENGTVTIPKYDDTQVKADIDALETLVGTEKVDVQIQNAITALKLAETYDAKGAASTALTEAKSYTDTLANGAVKGNTDAIAAIKDGTTIDSFADVEASIKATAETAAEETAQALVDAKAYADGKDAAIAAALKAGTDAQADVDALEGKVGTVAEGKTVVQMIEDAQTAATYDDEEVRGLIKDNADAIDAIEADYLKAADKQALQEQITDNKEAIEVLNGTGEGSVDKKITDAFNKFATDVTNDDVVNSYKELIEWAATHGGEAAQMAGAIKTNADAIDALEGRMDAAEADIDALEGRADELEAKKHEHANKALLDTYTQTEANLADAVAKKHAHENAAVLEALKATDVQLWNQTATDLDVLEAAVGPIEEGKTLVDMVGEAKDAAIESATYDDTEVRGLIKTNADDIDAVEGRVGTLETNAVLDGDTLILSCGDSKF